MLNGRVTVRTKILLMACREWDREWKTRSMREEDSLRPSLLKKVWSDWVGSVRQRWLVAEMKFSRTLFCAVV